MRNSIIIPNGANKLNNMNYEAEVKKVYPDAVCVGHGSTGNWYILFRSDIIHASDIVPFKKMAWQSAYEQITNQTKLAD